jgi:glycosyltransferase involved in cell wall biosynthesis
VYRELSVAVVVPAFNEEHAIAGALADLPGLVDRVIVVDDASSDATGRAASASADPRVEVIRHGENRGVGAAIISGYRRALGLGIDVAVVMAGDGQMDAADLPGLLAPLAAGHADYAKGNRFAHRDVWRVMPAARIAGNIALSLATKLTSGYWRLFDSQCGYTAITRRALEAIELDRVFPRYGYPNDLLARLRAVGARVVDVPVRPVYGPGWSSGIRPYNVIYPIAFVLARSWWHRLSAALDRRRPPLLVEPPTP